MKSLIFALAALFLLAGCASYPANIEITNVVYHEKTVDVTYSAKLNPGYQISNCRLMQYDGKDRIQPMAPMEIDCSAGGSFTQSFDRYWFRDSGDFVLHINGRETNRVPWQRYPFVELEILEIAEGDPADVTYRVTFTENVFNVSRCDLIIEYSPHSLASSTDRIDCSGNYQEGAELTFTQSFSQGAIKKKGKFVFEIFENYYFGGGRKFPAGEAEK